VTGVALRNAHNVRTSLLLNTGWLLGNGVSICSGTLKVQPARKPRNIPNRPSVTASCSDFVTNTGNSSGFSESAPLIPTPSPSVWRCVPTTALISTDAACYEIRTNTGNSSGFSESAPMIPTPSPRCVVVYLRPTTQITLLGETTHAADIKFAVCETHQVRGL
jgi:hypothetical protein